MKSKEFIVEKLKELVSIFPDLKVRYEFDSNTLTHKIEINPLELFESNDDYLNAEMNLENDFEDTFPNENIIFISNDSLTQIHNPEYEFGYNISIGEQTYINFHYDISKIFNSLTDLFQFELTNSFLGKPGSICERDLAIESTGVFEFDVSIMESYQVSNAQENDIITENYALAA